MKRKKALLFIFEGYCEFEIATAISILRSTHELFTFSIEKSPCKSEAGITTLPDLIIGEVNPLDYDALIIPGGDLELIVNLEEELFLLVKEFTDLGKIIAAICSGGYILGKAGVLNERIYTVTLTLTKEQRDFLGCFHEENFQYKPVIISQNIITAQGHAYVEFGIELAKKLRDVQESVLNFYKGYQNCYMEKDGI